MPDFNRYVEEVRDDDGKLSAPWTKLPFPGTWEALESGVVAWLELVWGPEWRCPHCKHRFWMVFEAVRLDSGRTWPIKATSDYGSYPIVPVVCVYCKQATPVLLYSIFEQPTGSEPDP